MDAIVFPLLQADKRPSLEGAPLSLGRTVMREGYCTNGKIGIFTCILCNFTTTTKKYLNRHLRRHDKSGRVSCPACNCQNDSLESLFDHVEGSHASNGMLSCKICTFSTSGIQDFILHMSNHNPINILLPNKAYSKESFLEREGRESQHQQPEERNKVADDTSSVLPKKELEEESDFGVDRVDIVMPDEEEEEAGDMNDDANVSDEKDKGEMLRDFLSKHSDFTIQPVKKESEEHCILLPTENSTSRDANNSIMTKDNSLSNKIPAEEQKTEKIVPPADKPTNSYHQLTERTEFSDDIAEQPDPEDDNEAGAEENELSGTDNLSDKDALLKQMSVLRNLSILTSQMNTSENQDETMSGYFPCHLCSYVAIRKDYLVRHIGQHAGKGMLYCPHCTYSTIRKEHMKRHVKLHTEGVLRCDQCEYTTRRKEQYRMHMASHEAEDHLQCPYCFYISIKKEHMKRHIARHTAEKASQCPFCQYTTDRKERMRKHVSTFHSDSIEDDNGVVWWKAVGPVALGDAEESSSNLNSKGQFIFYLAC